MRQTICTTALLVAASLASGCTLYFGGDDDCNFGGAVAYDELRDPNTGECVPQGGGGGGGCYAVPAEDIAMPDWASCFSGCEGLDETTCFATPGCYTAYEDSLYDCADGTTDCMPPSGRAFLGCWGTAPSGPIQGACDGLDAQSCSEHDDCSLIYTTTWDADGTPRHAFSYCAPEPNQNLGCYSDLDCPGGYVCDASTVCNPPPDCPPGADCPAVCYGQCVPAQNTCDTVDCGLGSHCELQCAYPGNGAPDSAGVDAACWAVCVPDYPTCGDGTTCAPGEHCETTCSDPVCDPASGVCTQTCTDTCVPDVPAGCAVVDCAPGYHCEESCPACNDPNDPTCGAPCTIACVPDGVPDPGTCDGLVMCDAMPPACPVDTVPGVSNGCWSGYCIPVADCAPNDPGTCYEPVACDMAPPACPDGSTAGVRNGCYTGYCIPTWACDQTAACEALTTEAECTARLDCTAIYTGAGCTCSADGTCTCTDTTFDHCETGGVVMPPTDPIPL